MNNKMNTLVAANLPAACRTLMGGAARRLPLLAAALLLTALTACRNGRQSAVPGVQEVSGFYDAKAATMTDTQQQVVRYELPARLKDRPEQILTRLGYTVSYNSTTRCPNWVAWHLTADHTRGSHSRQNEQFTEDTSVAEPRATNQDYYNSRYDRGHLCPAGDSKWSAQAMAESFLLTNICPQNHGLNSHEWNDVEMLCREWARKYGAIDIVCGPLYTQPAAQQRTIGRNRVWVPDRLFKVVLCRKGTPKAIGFIYRNEGKKQLMEEAVCTVDEVERLTGIDFFPALDDKTEKRIEAEAKLADW